MIARMKTPNYITQNFRLKLEKYKYWTYLCFTSNYVVYLTCNSYRKNQKALAYEFRSSGGKRPFDIDIVMVYKPL